MRHFRFSNIKQRLRNVLVASVFIGSQAGFALVPFLPAATASAAAICINDQQLADDEPGQKDLTRFCEDSGANTIAWNWDELSVNGNGQSLDACALFDTDGDGFANRALCISTQDGDPFSKTIYTCNDSRADRCAGADTGNPASSSCSLAVTPTQPFAAGSDTPDDLTANCSPTVADTANGDLIDVCSFPSGQPNSDPSDCVVAARAKAGKLEVRKDIVPDTDTGLFNLQIDGETEAANVGDNGTTGEVVVSEGNHSVGELAGTNTSLASYTSNIVCKDLSGTGATVASGAVTSLANVPVADGSDVICVITNTRDKGTIELKKVWVGTAGQTTLNIGTSIGGTQIASQPTSQGSTTGTKNVDTGLYYVSETAIPGYSSALACKNGQDTVNSDGGAVSVGSGQAIICTYTNTQLKGNISIKKYNVNADGVIDANTPVLSGWTFFIDTNNNGVQNNGETSANSNANGIVNFNNLPIGQYNICEVMKAGWMKIVPQNASPNCTTITVTADQTVTVNFGNFKKGKISGYKYHDLNGNGQRDGIGLLSEPKINDWNIYLFKDGSQVPTATTQTSSSLLNFGNYSFDNLAPGAYTICEERPIGWLQITPDPDVDPCYSFVIGTSGQQETAIFGNQAVGTIQVIKNVDNGGNNFVTNSHDWTWNYFGLPASGTGIETGSNPVNVPTGLFGNFYLVTEDQKPGYDLTDIDCNVPFLQIGDVAKVFVTKATNVVCTFTNTKRANVTISKDAFPADGTDFDFSLSKHAPNQDINHWWWGNKLHESEFTLDDAAPDDGDNIAQDKTFSLKAGTYYVTEEDIPDNWNLDGIECTGAEYLRQGNTVAINVETGAEVHCTFTNKKDGDVIVNKYNDLNRNNQYDPGEELLPDWEFTLSSQGDCDEFRLPQLLNLDQIIIDDCDNGTSQTEVTDQNGQAIFNNVTPDTTYELTETIPANSNWSPGSTTCTDQNESTVATSTGDATTSFDTIIPGSTITCYVGNYRDAALELTKVNDTPNPVNTGASVTYTLTVTVPEDGGAVFGAEVTDLPPEGFVYVPGSWTASSNMGPIEVAEPTYGSPGGWKLGNLLPGQIVTLTYRTIISASASNGTYPDVAFARGCNQQTVNGLCVTNGGAQIVFANVTTAANSPFVGTTVTVISPAVLAANTIRYVNTGASSVWFNTLAAITLAGATLITLVRREQKGAK